MILRYNIGLNRIEFLTFLAPDLSMIILMRKLNSNELSENLCSWIVNYNNLLSLILM